MSLKEFIERIKLSLMPRKKKHCGARCLGCLFYKHCKEELQKEGIIK